MAWLWKFKKGWQEEHLAKYILWKFCFVSEPSTVADDAWTDLFCTIFEKINDSLFPKNTFAIQIKSNKRKIKIKNNNYFINLEIPYLVWVIKDNKLEIYWWEGITHFFRRVANPSEVETWIVLKDENYLDNLYSPQTNGNGKYDLYFNKITELSYDFDYERDYEKIEKITQYCSVLQRNISSVVNHEYLLFRYWTNNNLHQEVNVLRWPASIQYFERNFINRLIEVFYNIERQYHNNYTIAKINFETYKKIYKSLEDSFRDPLPRNLTEIYNCLERLFNQ